MLTASLIGRTALARLRPLRGRMSEAEGWILSYAIGSVLLSSAMFALCAAGWVTDASVGAARGSRDRVLAPVGALALAAEAGPGAVPGLAGLAGPHSARCRLRGAVRRAHTGTGDAIRCDGVPPRPRAAVLPCERLCSAYHERLRTAFPRCGDAVPLRLRDRSRVGGENRTFLVPGRNRWCNSLPRSESSMRSWRGLRGGRLFHLPGGDSGCHFGLQRLRSRILALDGVLRSRALAPRPETRMARADGADHRLCVRDQVHRDSVGCSRDRGSGPGAAQGEGLAAGAQVPGGVRRGSRGRRTALARQERGLHREPARTILQPCVSQPLLQRRMGIGVPVRDAVLSVRPVRPRGAVPGGTL